jgi:serine/threonine-protein kinase RsbW
VTTPLTVDSGHILSAHLVLASSFENIEVAERALLDLCDQAGCGGEDEYWIVTALREALANAVRHGNKQDPDRKVDVRYRIEDGRVEIRIEDEGDGFDLDAVPDPTHAENLLRPNGRGIFYMRQFMNRVEFSRADSGGTAVLMVRELAPTTRSNDDEVSNS